MAGILFGADEHGFCWALCYLSVAFSSSFFCGSFIIVGKIALMGGPMFDGLAGKVREYAHEQRMVAGAVALGWDYLEYAVPRLDDIAFGRVIRISDSCVPFLPVSVPLRERSSSLSGAEALSLLQRQNVYVYASSPRMMSLLDLLRDAELRKQVVMAETYVPQSGSRTIDVVVIQQVPIGELFPRYVFPRNMLWTDSYRIKGHAR